MEREALAIIERIERMGGMVPCIQNGVIQKEIAVEAYRHQQRVESGERVVVGVNKFTREEPERAQLELYQTDPILGERQRTELARIKSTRDHARVAVALANLREAARGTANLMPPILDAAACYATVGEISDRLRTVFGEYRET